MRTFVVSDIWESTSFCDCGLEINYRTGYIDIDSLAYKCMCGKEFVSLETNENMAIRQEYYTRVSNNLFEISSHKLRVQLDSISKGCTKSSLEESHISIDILNKKLFFNGSDDGINCVERINDFFKWIHPIQMQKVFDDFDEYCIAQSFVNNYGNALKHMSYYETAQDFYGILTELMNKSYISLLISRGHSFLVKDKIMRGIFEKRVSMHVNPYSFADILGTSEQLSEYIYLAKYLPDDITEILNFVNCFGEMDFLNLVQKYADPNDPNKRIPAILLKARGTWLRSK